MWVTTPTSCRLGSTFGSSKSPEHGRSRFYVPGSYAGLDQRTDFAGEIELSVPVGEATLFVHWRRPTVGKTPRAGVKVGSTMSALA